ncbi:MAG TPA: PVC-type heme-binding CxxCH protein [Hanamia sp.]|nr:PVC-type heme-binding CxxCH protein [Hanamia sp.]
MKNKLISLFSLPALLFVLLMAGCKPHSLSPFSESAESALSTFKLPPGFKIELVAADPLISDPVDMTIDEEGRMYVVEMHGYPLDLNHRGKIIMLRDTNGDGKMDTRTVFADSLVLPTGVMRWKKGIIVTDPPNVYYMEDTNGDGKADIKKVMLTGFALTNPQYLVNRPLYGLDNWIYLAHEGIEETDTYQKEFGDPGKDIFYPDDPKGPRLPVNAQGHIVRFRPDVHALEETSGSTQFGQTFDDWGHHFLVYNANHIYQEVIASRYLKRNPDQIVGDATESLSDHGDACEVYPITKNPEHQLLTDVGVITSACGITDYQGGAFPDKFNQNTTFVCEPVSNLIHADHLKDNGATFIASRSLEHQAFLASTDAWFRPVNMYIGPDGALYVVDYYREIIEHPEWMSKAAIESGKLYNGRDKGRIYRISATDAPAASWTSHLNLNDSTDIQLVEKLSSPNIWWRRNAQRLLIDRNHDMIIPALVKMAQNTQSPLGRLHALWTLEGMHKLTPELIMQALHDPEPGVRENAIKLAELHLTEWPDLAPKLIALKEDNNAKVRYQLLCTLGSVNTPGAGKARQELLFKDINDKWVQIAALSASSQTSDMLESVLKKFNPAIPAYASLVTRLGTIIGASKDSKTIHSFLKRAVEPTTDAVKSWKAPLLEGIAGGLKNRKLLPEGFQSERKLLISVCLHHPDVNIRRSARSMLEAIGISNSPMAPIVMQEAQRIAANKNISSDKRAEAINLMALQNPKNDVAFLESLITPDGPTDIQLAAVQALDKVPGTTFSEFLLKNWPSLSPGIRDAALNTFITEPFSVPRISLLLQSVAKGKITKGELGWPVTVILMRDIPDSLKEIARTLLSGKKEDRSPVIKKYEASLQMKGNAGKGKMVYVANCLVCHQVRGKIGVAFGPDLGTVQGWPAENILINVLDPNHSISHGYELWNIVLNDGTMEQGIIVSETSNAIVLNHEGGVKTTIARKDIRSLRTLDVSPMPNDFEKRIDKQQMADLIAFIKQGD